MEILKQIEAFESEMIGWRRWLHVHPELSGQEDDTCRMICEHLAAWDIEYTDVPDGGVLGWIRGSQPGQTVLLRADIDALPIDEDPYNLKGPKVCVSSRPGAAHMCGHDAHAATLLAAARVLAQRRAEIAGTIILLFERGEEKTGNCIKLYRWLEEHEIPVDSAFGLHLHADLPSGMVALNDGPAMASNLCFDVKIRGRGGHGSRPEQAVSPIDCFVAVYNALHTLRMRKISPFQPLTFSIGQLQSGTTNNVIPEELLFRGSARFYDIDEGLHFKQALTDTLDHITRAYDCTYEYTLLRGPCRAVINDAQCAALARSALAAEVGAEHVCQCEPKMGSETFGKMSCKWPGVYAFLGIRNEALGVGSDHHNAKFDVDDSALKYGAAAYVTYALAFLQSGIDVTARKYPGTFADLYVEQGVEQKLIDYISGKTDELILR